MPKPEYILGIETSCDETGMALYHGERGLLAHRLYSQTDIHAEFGGVVPELASRDHVRRAIPLLRATLSDADTGLGQLDGIAYTAGPGLIGALLVGAALGRSLAWTLGIPAIGIHHMEAHLLAPMLEARGPGFPFIALLVSGGHTQLVEVRGLGNYRLLGEALDDAAGEAFDKVATLLGLGYPGGPEIDRLARHGRNDRFRFPRPMTRRPGLDFSFAGLKTFAMNTLEREANDPQTRADIARAFVDAVVDTLVIKCRRAVRSTGIKRLIASGGVSANSQLRERLERFGKEERVEVYYPRPEFCTDNGAMVAYVGYLRLAAGQAQQTAAITASARWSITAIDATRGEL